MHESPVGIVLEVRLMLPANLYPVIVIVELPVLPACMEMFDGLADITKSGAKLPTSAMTVFQSGFTELARYSPETQKVEFQVGTGSVPAPK
ncbi:hypothetical protein E6H26_06320 [Candidatus Bathyarchaeota archaeon]|nr:MAG: hypothetical protein E6H26_06320 [Candidatus Bathyarchaeota archaeon]